MVSGRGKKSDNLNILQDIYNEPSDVQSDLQNDPLILPKKSASFKNYFKNKQKVDRLLAVAILFFGLAGVGLGLFQFQDNLTNAFAIYDTDDSEIGLDNNNAPDEDLLGLRQKDTDQDGLSDYDELYAYATSPFLPDTDSDGLGDQQEIADGTDPNCPVGQNCFATDSSSLTTEKAQEYADLVLGGDNKIANLRIILQQAGLTEAELNQFSDEELLQVYQDLLLDQSTGAIKDPTDTGLITDPTAQDLSSLTPDQLRNLLRLSGVSESILSSISDEELLSLVQDLANSDL